MNTLLTQQFTSGDVHDILSFTGDHRISNLAVSVLHDTLMYKAPVAGEGTEFYQWLDAEILPVHTLRCERVESPASLKECLEHFASVIQASEVDLINPPSTCELLTLLENNLTLD